MSFLHRFDMDADIIFLIEYVEFYDSVQKMGFEFCDLVQKMGFEFCDLVHKEIYNQID